MSFKAQRIRDPLHNLIEFRANQFEDKIWKVIQAEPFQRLRRIKQLGFSELVYPGATHTRFAHSLGVFHTARRLMKVVEEDLGSNYEPTKANIALAASLVHDIGHGPFSHAFEEVGKRLNLKNANHEAISDHLIRKSQISEILKELGSGFDSDVADVIKSTEPKDIYSAVVSSQFDADRLDYMRRDRLMAGTQHGAIDFDWLLSNIKVGEVSYGVDNIGLRKVETFVLSAKALYAAESYLLGLFQLYPTVYLHKTTRGAEKIYTEILVRIFELVRRSSIPEAGLPVKHPLIQFAKRPELIDRILDLDDMVIWGAIAMMQSAKDKTISDFSKRLQKRSLLKCVDIRENLKPHQEPELLEPTVLDIKEKIQEWKLDKEKNGPRILIDQSSREAYKEFRQNAAPLKQIMIEEKDNGRLVDLSSLSSVVKAIKPFSLLRAYIDPEDQEASKFLTDTIKSPKV